MVCQAHTGEIYRDEFAGCGGSGFRYQTEVRMLGDDRACGELRDAG
jgi:hypothetical protein